MKRRLNFLIPTLGIFVATVGSLRADKFAELVEVAEQAQKHGDYDRAIVYLTSAFVHARTPVSQARIYCNRGEAYWLGGEVDRAIKDWSEAIRLNPMLADAYNNRGTAYFQKGDHQRALADYRKASAFSPALGLNGLAWVLSTCPEDSVRDGKQAVEVARRSCDLNDWKNWRYIDTLSAAYAEAGDFERAIGYAKQARNMPSLTDADRAEIQTHLDSYEKKKPLREALKR